MKSASWLAVSEPRPPRRLPPAILLSPAWLISAILLGFAGHVAKQEALPAVMVAISGIATMTFYVATIRKERRWREFAIREDEAPMLPELGVREGILVAMWVMQRDAITGYDRGTVWVEDGRLMFNGRRTSFALGKDVVESRSRSPRGCPGEIVLRLRESTPVGPLRVALTPLFGDRPYFSSLDYVVAQCFEGQYPVQEPSQLPPLGLGPGVLDSKSLHRRLLAQASFDSACLTLFAAPLAVWSSSYALPFVVFLLLFGLDLLWRAPDRRAIRDRKLLEDSIP